MNIDIELYRRQVRVSIQPSIQLSVIDIAPEFPAQNIVFVHGFGGRATQWVYQLNGFSQSNRVIAFDLRGHGRSDKPASGYNMANIQTDLEIVLDTLGIVQNIILVGHSFGGAVISEFAATHPSRVNKLVLIATAGKFELNSLYHFLLHLPSSILNLLSPFTRKWLGAPPTVLKAWYSDNLSGWDGWNLFHSLQVPTLVIRGHMDRVFEQPMFEEVARAIPGSEEVDVGASGHMVILERKDAINRAISRFIEVESGHYTRPGASQSELEQSELIKQYPWLAYYDNGVPYTVAIPRVPVHELLHSATRRYLSKTALIFEGNRISYRRLEAESNRFANVLLSLGVVQGERVMLVLPNLPQLAVAYFGCLKAGTVAVFAQPGAQPGEIIRQVIDSGAVIIVGLLQMEDLFVKIKDYMKAEGDLPLRQVIFTDVADYLPFFKRLAWRMRRENHRRSLPLLSQQIQSYLYSHLLYSHQSKVKEVNISPQELAVLLYTGGTTDRPRGVMLSHRNLIANALQTRHWMPEAEEGNEVFLSALPFSHSYGLTAALNVPISLGATIVLKTKFEVEDILRTIQKYKPTFFPGVPKMYVGIKDFPGVRQYGISTIKACISGSAPLPVEVQEAFEKLTKGRLVEGYGLTEAGPVTHANPIHGRRKTGSIGLPLPSTHARVVDLRRKSKEVRPGQIGELAVRGPQVMLGYWQDETATRNVLSPDGWLLTGDVALMDSEGYFRIIARKADMWYPNQDSQPAFPRDIEEILFEIPQVKEAAVVAIAHQPIAFIIATSDRPSKESIRLYCQRRLPPELVPRVVVFVDDFPRTFIGKVLRRELAQLFHESSQYQELGA